MMGISFGGCGMTGKRFGALVFFLAVSMLTLNSGYVFAQDSKGAAHAVFCH